MIMKKQIIYISTILMSGWILLSACNNTGATSTLQAPIGMQTENTAGGETTTTGTSADAKTKITNDLLAAFKGETTASAKYAAYSKKAEQEGFHQIALLFKAASAAEKIHANNHKTVLEDAGTKVGAINPEFTVKSTKENLLDAIRGESYEASTMYPEFLKDADAAGNQMALLTFNYAFKTEKKHRVLYENALAALESNNVKSVSSVYYVCPTCGNTYEADPSSRCGICMTSSEKYVKISSL